MKRIFEVKKVEINILSKVPLLCSMILSISVSIVNFADIRYINGTVMAIQHSIIDVIKLNREE